MGDPIDALRSLSPRQGVDYFFDDVPASVGQDIGIPPREDLGIRSFLSSCLPKAEFDFGGIVPCSDIYLPLDLPDRFTVSSRSLVGLFGFSPNGDHGLVRKSERDLWKITEADSGFVIERLFDEDGAPLTETCS